jgi:signal transduction histidine kinase
MRQLFLNLIGNSLKYRKPAEPPLVRISGGRAEDPAFGFVRISDNGIGFEDKYRDRIFLLFQRLHRRDEYDGTGIGLAICRKIARRHGGEISASGAPGVGSVFTVTLPLA